jgi:hypothetical protein
VVRHVPEHSPLQPGDFAPDGDLFPADQ